MYLLWVHLFLFGTSPTVNLTIKLKVDSFFQNIT